MEIRWIQRFDNFSKSEISLTEMVDLYRSDKTNKAYKLAVIQTFEMTVELAWKVLKDYLNFLQYKIVSPREAIKQAFASELIDNGEIWIAMIEDRNLTSHAYDETKADEIVAKIDEIYYQELQNFYNDFKGKIDG